MWLLGLYTNGERNNIGIDEFQEIFQELYPDLVLYASRFISDFDTCKDIVQEVLAWFWEENHKLRNKNLVRPYLFRAVKNKALNHNKRESRFSRLDDFLMESNIKGMETENQDAISFISYNSLKEDLENAIDELPEQRQKIFRLSRFEQLKHKEIAIKLNISPKTVETQIYRSLIFLRKKLNNYLN